MSRHEEFRTWKMLVLIFSRLLGATVGLKRKTFVALTFVSTPALMLGWRRCSTALDLGSVCKFEHCIRGCFASDFDSGIVVDRRPETALLLAVSYRLLVVGWRLAPDSSLFRLTLQ